MNKVASLALFVLMLTLCSPAVHADTSTSVDLSGAIGPLFTHISSLIPELSIDSSGCAVSFGRVKFYSSSQTVELTVVLQKSTTNGWTEVIAWSDTGAGFPGVSLERSHYVTRGTYRVCVTAKFYSEAGALLETAYGYSPPVTYWF